MLTCAWAVFPRRFGLILEIFASNATTKEAQLQVQLATARYEQTRLVRGGSRMTFGDERQVVSARGRGGGKAIGGGGEMQIELERRLLRCVRSLARRLACLLQQRSLSCLVEPALAICDHLIRSAFEWLVSGHRQKVSKLNKELDKVQRHRTLQRAGRKRSGAPVAALVGYTNAGKSALLNAITGASIVSQDRLFCTLDPTMRSTRLPVRTPPPPEQTPTLRSSLQSSG